MDTLYESEFGTRALHLPAVAPPPRVPRWVSAVGLLTLGLAAASVVCVALLFAQTASSHLVAPAAVGTGDLGAWLRRRHDRGPQRPWHAMIR